MAILRNRGSRKAEAPEGRATEVRLQHLYKKHGKRMPGWPRAIRKSYVELRVQNELIIELIDEIRGLREELRASASEPRG